MKHAGKVIYKFPPVNLHYTNVGKRIKDEQRRLAALAKTNVVAIKSKRKSA